MEKYFKRVSPAETGNSGQRMAHSSHVRPMAAAPMEAQSHAGMRRRLRGRGVHHDDPAGNAFNQMYALLAV